MKLDIEHQTQNHQFISYIDQKKAFLKYEPSHDGQVYKYTKTFVDHELRGKGLAMQLVEFALNYAKQNDIKVVPLCPVVKSYVESHEEYKDIIINTGGQNIISK